MALHHQGHQYASCSAMPCDGGLVRKTSSATKKPPHRPVMTSAKATQKQCTAKKNVRDHRQNNKRVWAKAMVPLARPPGRPTLATHAPARAAWVWTALRRGVWRTARHTAGAGAGREGVRGSWERGGDGPARGAGSASSSGRARACSRPGAAGCGCRDGCTFALTVVCEIPQPSRRMTPVPSTGSMKLDP